MDDPSVSPSRETPKQLAERRRDEQRREKPSKPIPKPEFEDADDDFDEPGATVRKAQAKRVITPFDMVFSLTWLLLKPLDAHMLLSQMNKMHNTGALVPADATPASKWGLWGGIATPMMGSPDGTPAPSRAATAFTDILRRSHTPSKLNTKDRFTPVATTGLRTKMFGDITPEELERKKAARRAQTAEAGPRDRKSLATKRVTAPSTAAFPIEQVKRCEEIFDLYDEDGGGKLDEEEFCVLYTVLMHNQRRTQQIEDDMRQKMFARFDEDRDGFLDRAEFVKLIKSVLSRMTAFRREDTFALLERGMDGGRKFMEKQAGQVEEDEEDEEEYYDGDPRAAEKKARKKPAERLEKYTKTMEEAMSIKEDMVSWAMCEGIKHTALTEIVQSYKLLQAVPGDFVIEEGDENCEVYVVKQGEFNVLVNNRKAGSTLREGDHFSECGLIGGKLASFAVVCSEPNSKMLVLRTEDFHEGARIPPEARFMSNRMNFCKFNTPLLRCDGGAIQRDHPGFLEYFATLCEPQFFESGERIIFEGDDAQRTKGGMYIVRKGSVFVQRRAAKTAVATLDVGTVFGEAALVTNSLNRNSTVVAGKPCKRCKGAGWRLKRKKPRPCGKCAQTGYVVDGAVHCMYWVTPGALNEILSGEYKWMAKYFQINIICSILRETDRFFDKTMDELLRIANKFVLSTYGHQEQVVGEGERWMYYSVVLEGEVSLSTRMDGYFGKCKVCSAFSDFDTVRSAHTVTTKEKRYGEAAPRTVIALLGRQEMREETTKGIPANTKKYKGKDMQFIKCVGAGTSWRTYLCKHKLSKQYFAVKMLHKRRIDVDKFAHANMSRLAQQRELMETASSPFIVRLHGSGYTDTHIFTVSDFMYGGELTNVLQYAPLRPNHCKFYAAGLALGLEYVREKHLVMRGLRPENIYIDNNGYPKIAGFGWAKKIRGMTSTKIGGMDYTAPECLVGHEHDQTADIWSFGAILYTLCTGKVPFADASKDRRNRKGATPEDIQMTYALMRKGLIGFPLDVPLKLQNLIRACMDPFPDQRLTHGDDHMKDIKGHTWLKDFDWEGMAEQRLTAPWIPETTGPEDLSNFLNLDAIPKEPPVAWSPDDEALGNWEPDFW